MVVLVTTFGKHQVDEEKTFADTETQTSISFTPGAGEGANSLINTHMVYNYDADGNVIGLKTYFKYLDEETAKAALEAMKDQPETPREESPTPEEN